MYTRKFCVIKTAIQIKTFSPCTFDFSVITVTPVKVCTVVSHTETVKTWLYASVFYYHNLYIFIYSHLLKTNAFCICMGTCDENFVICPVGVQRF